VNAGVPLTHPDLESYVRSSRPALLRRARHLTGEHHGAEDLVQTVLLRAFTSWEGLRAPAAADAYLRRAMVNQAASTWRRASRRYEHPTACLPEPRAAGGELPGLPGGPAPDDRKLLWELVQRLPLQQRRAVVLRYYEDLSEARTAEILGISVGTVKSNTSRGLRTLRRMASGSQLERSTA
jgi:RNA polymerase sigma-70 factor (sigma-E family)